MCNLYTETKGHEAIRRLTRVTRDRTGYLPPLPAIFPDTRAPVVRNAPDGARELIFLRWGMPAPPAFVSGPDRGVTNIRKLDSPHWRPWLGVANRCIVPATSFSEPSIKSDFLTGKKICHWFALGDDQPLFAFAGIWCTWRGIRGSKAVSIETEHELFGFLTTGPNAEVRTVHVKAMPVILRTEDEIELWMTAPIEDALALQRPLPDGSLKIVRTGTREDQGSTP
jgi:putative SOS response-associated peptidase YedK